MTLDASSLERLVPDQLEPGEATGEETHRLHLERYTFAAGCARPGRLLDLACGVGYGTRLLVERNPAIRDAVGADLSAEAVAYAEQRYGGERLRFAVAEALSLADPEGFDTIVSLETIEHLEADPGRFVSHLRGLLRPGGVLVVSAPTTPSVDLNPHHHHDFSERSFRRLFEQSGLRELAHLEQVQPVSPLAVLRGEERRLREVRPNLPAHYLRNPGALARRVYATLRYGFANRYLTVAWTGA